MAVILGINTDHASSAAALVIDGEVVAAIAEERLNRIKYYARFPKRAIAAVLSMANLQVQDIDHVAIPRNPRANLIPKFKYLLNHPHLAHQLLQTGSKQISQLDIRSQLATTLKVPVNLFRFRQHNIEHHLAHIASSYFCSPWDQAAGFSADGSGDFVSCMLASCQGPYITSLRRIHLPHSLGFLYTMICQFIGYQKFGDEGKVMGLAPYGNDQYHDAFQDMIQLTENGFRLNDRFFIPFGSEENVFINDQGGMEVARLWSDDMSERFGPSRQPNTEITQRDKDLAFGVQKAFEHAYLKLLCDLHQRVPLDRVVLAGGTALNSVANGKIFQQTPFQETWIQPAAGDDGLALGAALYVSQSILKEPNRYEMNGAYLGPEYSQTEIRSALDATAIEYRQDHHANLIEETTEHLVQGKIIGWFQGRMEWGPRALGNRSILAHPGIPTMKDTLNARIKRREWFRPFAPVVLEERQGEIFEESHPSPYMLHVYKICKEWRERLCAVNHVDDTGRLQSITRTQNPKYYDLIKSFESRTGIPVLVNTSFNENEPIVCTPEEAIACFQRTKMDVLVIGDFICVKSAESEGLTQ